MAYSKKHSLKQIRKWQRRNAKRYRLRNPEKVKRSARSWARRHPDRVVASWKANNKAKWAALTPKQKKKKCEDENARRRAIQQKAIQHYGGKCYCCGEKEKMFLSLDHKNGGGCKHRRQLKGIRVADWAKRHGWPSIFRVACHNCNFGAHLNGGICPHRKRR